MENPTIEPTPEDLEIAKIYAFHFGLKSDGEIRTLANGFAEHRAKIRTPNAALPPLDSGPRRKMVINIEVAADFEKRLDNQWMVEREIHADRWSWRWAHADEPKN